MFDKIFSIKIVYNDKEVIKTIEKELKKYGIEKYKLKKDYIYLNEVKENILKNNKDTLEWLEIVEKEYENKPIIKPSVTASLVNISLIFFCQ